MPDTNEIKNDTKDTIGTEPRAIPLAKGTVFKPEIRLDNVLVILTMLGAVGAGVFEGGMIRQSLESGLVMERSMRESEITAMHRDIDTLAGDVREIRTLILATRGPRGLP